ncbi:SDR family oxidoreductase [Rhodobacteraceae bacterium M385]|nr:SDR family oxidoreductase [Rhodobacteraceae bacterium M385]
MNFQDKSVMITGAGKGIGRDTARYLAARGAHIVAISRTRESLDSLAKEIGCDVIVADLANPDAARTAAIEGLPCDYLVNCAGINVLQPFVDVTVEAFDLVYAVNTRAAMIVAQEFARSLIDRQKSGAIVNVSSISSVVGFEDHASYCASKGAMDGMSRVMANELGPHGIRVNCINPIVTMTELAAEAWSDPVKAGPVLSRMPVGRFAETRDVASVIAFLLSDEAAMLSGLALPVDGGFLAN